MLVVTVSTLDMLAVQYQPLQVYKSICSDIEHVRDDFLTKHGHFSKQVGPLAPVDEIAKFLSITPIS